MKLKDKVEGVSTAWNRWVRVWKKSNRYCEDYEVPLRLRGYTELTMGDLPQKERKQIDTSLRRGYALAENNRAALFIQHLLHAADFNIGYLGKTRGSLWFPTTELRDECMRHMEAQLVMTERFSAEDMTARGKQTIRLQVSGTWGTNALKAHMTELRTVVDEHMAPWAYEREQFADQLLADAAVVRTPFDSYRGRK